MELRREEPQATAARWFSAVAGARPPLTTAGSTSMRRVASCVADIEERVWAHHIRLHMVLGNLALLAGVDPRQVTDWMWESFVDASEWVMVPNVVGMALYADGGQMSTKPVRRRWWLHRPHERLLQGLRVRPQAACRRDACPFTTLYWDFLLRHTDRSAVCVP